MFALMIFILIFLLISTNNGQIKPSELVLPSSRFVKCVQDYVLLHLVEELKDLSKLPDTVEGQNWLSAWENHRTKVISEILFQKPFTRKINWVRNWRRRLQFFDDEQKLYFKYIVDNFYDSRRKDSPWPKVIFDPTTKSLIVDFERFKVNKDERDLADPIVTDADIDQVLYHHRPLRKDERTKFLKKELTIKNKKKNFIHDLKSLYGLKEYQIINHEKITNLVEIRYELMRKSLKGLRKSDLDFQRAIFQGERISAAFDLSAIHGIKLNGDYNSEEDYYYYSIKRIPSYTQVLKDDESYRRYLNVDESFSNGNVFFGYENRYDDPSRYGCDFEYNAENLITNQRYKPLRELYDKIHEFEILSGGFKHYELQDFALIDSFLERFKVLTFWHSVATFKLNQWFLVPEIISKSKKPMFLIHSKSSENQPPEKIIKTVETIYQEAKKPRLIQDHSIVDSMLERSQHFQDQLKADISMIKRKKIFTGRWATYQINRILHYLNSLSTSKLLPFLSSMTPIHELLNLQHVSSEQRISKKYRDATNVKYEKIVDTDNPNNYEIKLNNMAENLRKTLDTQYNIIIDINMDSIDAVGSSNKNNIQQFGTGAHNDHITNLYQFKRPNEDAISDFGRSNIKRPKHYF